jgi:hypothetical protein
MTRPRVSGSSKSMTIISPWAKVENRGIAVPERHDRRRKADRGHEHRADRPAGIVAETLAGAAELVG